MISESIDLARTMGGILEEKKGENIVIMDVSQLSSITDYFVLVSGLNPPHLKALAGELERQLKKEGIRSAHRAGTLESQWIVLDFLNVVVHIFLPEIREYYSLERLWKDAPLLPLKPDQACPRD